VVSELFVHLLTHAWPRVNFRGLSVEAVKDGIQGRRKKNENKLKLWNNSGIIFVYYLVCIKQFSDLR